MDPLTHGLLGAACAQAVCGRTLGRRALAWGALAGMAPDADVVMNLTGPMAEWTWHRGLTHALWLPPLVAAVLGPWLWRRYGGRLWQWISLVALAAVSHPLLDAFTTYGTQLLAPFSRQRFAWNGVAIVDPAYTLVLAAALVVGWAAGTGSRRSRLAASAALVLTTAYLGLGVWLNGRVERIATAQLAAEGVRVERVAAYPTLLQLPLRRVVARGGGVVRVGWVSAVATAADRVGVVRGGARIAGGRRQGDRGRGAAVRVVCDGRGLGAPRAECRRRRSRRVRRPALRRSRPSARRPVGRARPARPGGGRVEAASGSTARCRGEDAAARALAAGVGTG